MSVYVDDMRAPYGWPRHQMIMCHMIADTSEELIGMARTIGVQTKWIQAPGTFKEHFDICLSKRKLALDHGAIPISQMDLARKIQGRRK